MPALTVIDSNANKHIVEFTSGLTLMEVLSERGFDEIAAICGGSCSCATCHVHVLSSPQEFPPIEDDEALLLELADDYEPAHSRLSCQLELGDEFDGLTIQLVANS